MKKPGNAGGAKGSWVKVNVGSGESQESGVSLVPPRTVEKLQATLHAKAKGSPDYRFYALYDKVYRSDVLEHAYRLCRRNGGAEGVDGQTFEDIETYGHRRWLDELTEELRTKRYRPEAVRRVHIPKPGQPGRTRPLGIPTIRDRVVMTAATLVLAPIDAARHRLHQLRVRDRTPRSAPHARHVDRARGRRRSSGHCPTDPRDRPGTRTEGENDLGAPPE